jgi:HSP20 family protein
MSGRSNPFEDLEEMIERMSRQFEASMGGAGMEQLTGGGASVDVADRGDQFVVTADLPGYRKEDRDVTLRGDQLQIRGEREESSEEGDGDEGHYIRKERRHESVSRSVSLPEAVEEESVSAQYRNGVLTVTLPKRGVAGDDSHQIDIS